MERRRRKSVTRKYFVETASELPSSSSVIRIEIADIATHFKI